MSARQIKHIELFGGYTKKRKIIIDAAEVFPGEYSVMAMYENGEEIEEEITHTGKEAIDFFYQMAEKYMEPLQRAVFTAGLERGKKYTLFYLNDFGFPVCQKVIFERAEFTTYAQYSDVVKLIFKPYRKRNLYQKYFYNCSLSIFEGWQNLKEEDTKEVIKENSHVKIIRSKYGCFDGNYIKDGNGILKNPVMIHENFKTGVNGKIYG